MSGDVSSAEIGLTSEDIGATEQVDKEVVAKAHTKILPFDTPEYFAGYKDLEGKPPPVIFPFTTHNNKQQIDMVATSHWHQIPEKEGKDDLIKRLDEQMNGYLERTTADPNRRLFMIEGGNLSNVTTLHDRIGRVDELAFHKNL